MQWDWLGDMQLSASKCDVLSVCGVGVVGPTLALGGVT